MGMCVINGSMHPPTHPARRPPTTHLARNAMALTLTLRARTHRPRLPRTLKVQHCQVPHPLSHPSDAVSSSGTGTGSGTGPGTATGAGTYTAISGRCTRLRHAVLLCC